MTKAKVDAKRWAVERALLRSGAWAGTSDWRALFRGERKHLDYKGPMSWVDAKTDLVKDIIAMSNVRDGGQIVIGVQENADTKLHEVVGLTDAQLASFDPTDVGKYVNNFVRGSVVAHVRKEEIDGKRVVVLDVPEFEQHPNICAKPCPKTPPTFHEGQILIRTDSAESRAIRTAEEMQEILRLAISKTSEALLRDMKRIIEGGAPALGPLDAYVATIEEWHSEIGNFRAELEQRYKAPRATFDCCIVPAEGTSLPHDYDWLKAAIRSAVVNRGGYVTFPVTLQYDEVVNRSGLIEGTGRTRSHERKWRLYTNGLFAFVENLRENDSDAVAKRGMHINFERAIAIVAIVLLFASRLGEQLSYDGALRIDFRWTDTAERVLLLEMEDWRIARAYKCQDPEVNVRLELTTSDLKAGWESHATKVLRELANLFQFDEPSAVIAAGLAAVKRGV